MSFGLNKFLKVILPKGLFYRSLIIVAAPIIILQIIVAVAFFYIILIKWNKGIVRYFVAEHKTINDVQQMIKSILII